MFTVRELKTGKDALVNAIEMTLLRTAEAKELQWQRKVYDQDPDVAMPDNPGQYTGKIGEFVPNKDQARQRAKTTIRMGVGKRLEGAIALYEIGEQMECVRHIILALDTIFCILDWDKASAWCNEQNRILFEAHKKAEKSAA